MPSWQPVPMTQTTAPDWNSVRLPQCEQSGMKHAVHRWKPAGRINDVNCKNSHLSWLVCHTSCIMCMHCIINSKCHIPNVQTDNRTERRLICSGHLKSDTLSMAGHTRWCRHLLVKIEPAVGLPVIIKVQPVRKSESTSSL